MLGLFFFASFFWAGWFVCSWFDLFELDELGRSESVIRCVVVVVVADVGVTGVVGVVVVAGGGGRPINGARAAKDAGSPAPAAAARSWFKLNCASAGMWIVCPFVLCRLLLRLFGLGCWRPLGPGWDCAAAAACCCCRRCLDLRFSFDCCSSCNCMNIMWSSTRKARVSGSRPDRKSSI